MKYIIRKAGERDAEKIYELLLKIAELHHGLRPDLFKTASSKYSISDLCKKMQSEDERMFVAADENESVLGYVLCTVRKVDGSPVLADNKTLYVDDLCVDEAFRKNGIATALMDEAVSEAKKIGCHNLTLNVWQNNSAAERFYEGYGMKTQSRHLEIVLD